MQHGRDSEEEIRIDDKKGFHRFIGLKDLMLVYDDLEDRAELEWYEMELTKAKIQVERLAAYLPQLKLLVELLWGWEWAI